MVGNRVAVAVAVLMLLLAGSAACGPTRRGSSAPQSTPLRHVTANQVAQAMQADNFFAAYGKLTLFVAGTVSSVNRQNNDQIVALQTDVPTIVRCEVSDLSAPIHVGQSITIQAQTADAQREPSAVMLRNCKIVDTP